MNEAQVLYPLLVKNKLMFYNLDNGKLYEGGELKESENQEIDIELLFNSKIHSDKSEGSAFAAMQKVEKLKQLISDRLDNGAN